MDILHLEGTEDTPKVLLNHDTGIMEISGRSLPEDSTTFFKPVLDWIRQYANDARAESRFVFKLDYFNTSSSKLILDVLYTLEGIKGTRIEWFFHEEDEDMEEAGQEFSELVEIPFEFKTY